MIDTLANFLAIDPVVVAVCLMAYFVAAVLYVAGALMKFFSE